MLQRVFFFCLIIFSGESIASPRCMPTYRIPEMATYMFLGTVVKEKKTLHFQVTQILKGRVLKKVRISNDSKNKKSPVPFVPGKNYFVPVFSHPDKTEGKDLSEYRYSREAPCPAYQEYKSQKELEVILASLKPVQSCNLLQHKEVMDALLKKTKKGKSTTRECLANNSGILDANGMFTYVSPMKNRMSAEFRAKRKAGSKEIQVELDLDERYIPVIEELERSSQFKKLASGAKGMRLSAMNRTIQYYGEKGYSFQIHDKGMVEFMSRPEVVQFQNFFQQAIQDGKLPTPSKKSPAEKEAAVREFLENARKRAEAQKVKADQRAKVLKSGKSKGNFFHLQSAEAI